jgi:Glycosyltransferase
LKILLVGPDKLSSEYGGGQVYVKNLVAGLLANQHDVSYMSITFADIFLPQRLWTSCNNIKELQLIMPANWRVTRNSAGKSHITDEIASVCKELSPDIVHAHGWKEYACIGAKQCGVPCVVTAHHGGIVCPAGALLNANDEICRIPANARDCYRCCIKAIPGWRVWFFLLNRVPTKVALPIGRYISSMPFIPFVTPLGIIPCSIKDKIESVRAIGHNADRVIAPSPAIGDVLVRNGVPEQKVVVVPHGIPPFARRPLPEGLGKRPLKLLYLGRINHVKGLHIMLEACARLPGNAYELHIVGEAVTRQEKRYCRKLKKKFPNVSAVWHGGKPHDEIPELITSCDLMIHPAICLEVFGLTIAESLALGRPVLASRCGGAEIQVRDGENGFLVPPNDPTALADKIQYLLQNPKEILRLASNIQPVRSLEEHVHDLLDLYRAVI